MRFIISGDIKRRKNLYWAVLFFSIFSFFFWISSFLYYYLNFGFDYNSLFKYYFTDLDFPEKVSLQQISENVHMNLFLNGFLILMVVSILNVFEFKEKVKLILIVLTFFFGILYTVSDFIVYFLDGFVILKPISFVFFQLILGLDLFLIFYGLTKRKSNVSIKNLRVIIVSFSFLMLIFFFLNFLLFNQKIGFCFDCIKSYYLGNPENYTKPKTLEGLFKTFYPHLLTMSLISFVLSHFLFFTSINRVFVIFLGVSSFVFSFLDNLSGFLIRFVSDFFVYLKTFSFFNLELVFIIGFLIVLYKGLKKEPY